MENTPTPTSRNCAFACAYLSLFGAALVAWLHQAGAQPRWEAAFCCAAPVLLVAAWGWRRAGLGWMHAAAVLPLLQLLWLQNQPVALPPVVTALHALLCLACHAAACTAAMARLGLPAWPLPKMPAQPQFSWVTNLVLR